MIMSTIITRPGNNSDEFSELQEIVTRASQGDVSTLPALRQLLDEKSPGLDQKMQDLRQQAERAWLQALCGEDLVQQEVLVRQLATFRAALTSPYDTPLELLLVDRVVLTWTQLQYAEMEAARHLPYLGSNREEWNRKRVERLERQMISAIKSLKQVRKIRPDVAVQVNIGQQQVNIS
jgi:hypothetical protein